MCVWYMDSLSTKLNGIEPASMVFVKENVGETGLSCFLYCTGIIERPKFYIAVHGRKI